MVQQGKILLCDAVVAAPARILVPVEHRGVGRLHHQQGPGLYRPGWVVTGGSEYRPVGHGEPPSVLCPLNVNSV
jgi:hypothetical protein